MIDKNLFTASITSPKQKNKMVLVLTKKTNNVFGKLLPASAAMTTCVMSLDGEGVVEQKYALFCPTVKIAILGYG